MKKHINIEKLICFIEGSLDSSDEIKKVSNLIENDLDWFNAYVDLKSSYEQLNKVQFEVTPDILLDSNDIKVKHAKSSFSTLGWLLKPQIAIGVACLFIVVFFVGLNRDVEELDIFDTNFENYQYQSVADNSNVFSIEKNNDSIIVFNQSTDTLKVIYNDNEYLLTMLDSLEISIDDIDSIVQIYNSNSKLLKSFETNKN